MEYQIFCSDSQCITALLCDKHPATFVCPVVDARREYTCYWVRLCGSQLGSRKSIFWHSFEKILLINDHAGFLQKFPKPERPCMVGAIPCGCPGSGLIREQGNHKGLPLPYTAGVG